MLIDNYTKHSQYRDKQGFLHSDWRHCGKSVGYWNEKWIWASQATPMQLQRAKLDSNYLIFCEQAIASAVRRDTYLGIDYEN